MLGLIGQEVAFARAMPLEPSAETVVAEQMSAECAEMMGLTKQQTQPGEPCKGMTPDCIAKMGCALSLALLPPLASNVWREFRSDTPPQLAVVPLVGRNTGPEPEPPTHLG